VRTYVAFTDPSGGSSDSFTLAVAHLSILRHAVLDAFLEKRPPFSPDSVVEEFAALLKSYRIATVVGDRYAGEWPRERFRVHGIEYRTSEKTKSEIYATFLVLVNSGRARIPGDKRLRAQLQSLERRSSRTGRDVIDHGVAGHDDIANAAAGALVLAASKIASRQPWSEVLYIGQDRADGDERFWHKLN
jgi:hypothetical protein